MYLLFLGVDIGTKRIKCTIIDRSGHIRESSQIDIYDLVENPKPGWFQRDALKIWERLKTSLSKLSLLKSVEAVCIDATSGTVIPINSHGSPIHPSLLYNDERAVEESKELRKISERAKDFEKLLPIAPYLVIPKVMWLLKHIGRKKIYRILHENDFIVYKLTEEIVTSPNIAGKSHIDFTTKSYIEEIYSDANVPLELMPRIKPIGAIIGRVTRQASRETGIPENTPVVNGVTDATAGDIATGIIHPGQACLSIGATTTLHAITEKLIPDEKRRFYYKPYLYGRYVAGGATNAGTTILDAYSNLFRMSLEELESLAEKIPPGSEGLLMQPEWTGTRIPRCYPNVKGFIYGLTEQNCTPGHIYRSALESISLVTSLLVEIVEEVTQTEISEIRTCGGGSKSMLLNQIIADSTNKKVLQVKSEASVGSAILASLPIVGDFKKIIEQIVSVERVFSPKSENLLLYNTLKRKLTKFVEFLASNF